MTTTDLTLQLDLALDRLASGARLDNVIRLVDESLEPYLAAFVILEKAVARQAREEFRLQLRARLTGLIEAPPAPGRFSGVVRRAAAFAATTLLLGTATSPALAQELLDHLRETLGEPVAELLEAALERAIPLGADLPLVGRDSPPAAEIAEVAGLAAPPATPPHSAESTVSQDASGSHGAAPPAQDNAPAWAPGAKLEAPPVGVAEAPPRTPPEVLRDIVGPGAAPLAEEPSSGHANGAAHDADSPAQTSATPATPARPSEEPPTTAHSSGGSQAGGTSADTPAATPAVPATPAGNPSQDHPGHPAKPAPAAGGQAGGPGAANAPAAQAQAAAKGHGIVALATTGPKPAAEAAPANAPGQVKAARQDEDAAPGRSQASSDRDDRGGPADAPGQQKPSPAGKPASSARGKAP
ncbi:MAG: hypothetical protein C0506_09265 [Anaerolinea sp.]|nr:hypothetical protein [Anaerolinea sp.]